jgi:hypothetical protein
MLKEMGSLPFEINLPEIGGDWTEVFTKVFREYAGRPTPGVKRARTEVNAEIRRIRAAQTPNCTE